VINADFISIRDPWGRFERAPSIGAIRAMAMTICCDFRAINGEAKACAGAALILGGLLLLIAP
jgi:hypothetical protein